MGGVALFLAKPPGAAATGVVVGLAIVLMRRSPHRVWFAAGLATLTMVVIMIIVDGSPAGTVARFRDGAEELRALDAGHSLRAVLLVDGLDLGPSTIAAGLGSLSAVTGLTWALTTVPGRRERALVAVGGERRWCSPPR